MTTSGKMTTCSRCGQSNPAWYAACEKCGAQLTLAKSDFSLNREAGLNKPRASQAKEMSVMAHVLCGWPLILVLIGGLIGGALGAAAYAINTAIYKSKMPAVFKLVLNLGVGFSAIAVWLLFAYLISK